MRYSPHEYQKYAINFIKEHPIAAILLDMGMGKTSIVLAAINALMFDSFEISKVLSNLIALCKSCHSRIHADRGDRWHNKTAARKSS